MRSTSRRLRLRLYRLLYGPLAWAYESVAWLVSFGQWDAWRKLALEYAQGDSLLEIGFGTGVLLAEAGGRDLRLVGLERAAEMHRQARAKLAAASQTQPLVRADVTCTPFHSQAFDAILSTFPAEFILEESVWRELSRLLRPHGRLVIVGIVVYLDHPLHRFLVRLLPGGKPSREWQTCQELARAVGLSVTTEVRTARWSRAPILIAAKPGDER
ncbi:MAG: class I SAM-dependent methyltransferase [Caldilineales bacterium]|nr:class I SAM-dependent methyltransferase [Caldilineales bacterium]